jgi:hypothetical protein
MRCRNRFALGLMCLLLACSVGCGSRSIAAVENVGGNGEDVSGFVLKSLKGTRDGETLEVQAVYGDRATRTLLVNLRFDVRPPARLTSGTWKGLGGEGAVEQRSVTFLGGQTAGPSIGGRFDLMSPDHRALYRITLPVQELKQPL